MINKNIVIQVRLTRSQSANYQVGGELNADLTQNDKAEIMVNHGYHCLQAILKQLGYHLTLISEQSLTLQQLAPPQCNSQPSTLTEHGLDDIEINVTKGRLSGIIVDQMSEVKQQTLPWISIAQLSDPALLENYLVRLCAEYKLQQLIQAFQQSATLRKGALIDFHSQYKLLLLAYSQPAYRQIGPYVAKISQVTSKELAQYRTQFMAILACQANRDNHTNVLLHIQGYFRAYLSAQQKAELVNLINHYHDGHTSLLSVIHCLNDYLANYPNSYLSSQYYLSEYPIILQACQPID